MNISEMNELEKSRKLVLLVGDDIEFYRQDKRYVPGEGLYPLNLYDPKHMALAWRVMNWAYPQSAKWRDSIDCILWGNWSQLPARAQAAWLDKILELANEEGIL